jgi:hypothetical protein
LKGRAQNLAVHIDRDFLFSEQKELDNDVLLDFAFFE